MLNLLLTYYWQYKLPTFQSTGMKSFPTVFELAAATEDEVNAHWAGLGFYRRARYLHQGAKYVVEELDGELPTTPQGLSKIAGIGPYTVRMFGIIFSCLCEIFPKIVTAHSSFSLPFFPPRHLPLLPSLLESAFPLSMAVSVLVIRVWIY